MRRILKHVLGLLCKLSVKKHQSDIILVTGWTGSGLVREMIYHSLKGKYNIRRNINEVWWDLSVPLCVLGYEDKRRNLLQWMGLIIKASYAIIVKNKYDHKIIINLDTANKETADFWSMYLMPSKIVALKENPKSKVIEKILKKDRTDLLTVVCKTEDKERRFRKINNVFTYSSKKGDLLYKNVDEKLRLTYKNESSNLRISKDNVFLWEFIPAAISVGLLSGESLEYLVSELSDFKLHPRQLEHALTSIKDFLGDNE